MNNKVLEELGMDLSELKQRLGYKIKKAINEKRLAEYIEGSKIGINLYNSYSEAYKSITGICNLYKAYDLFPIIDNLLNLDIKSEFKTLGRQILKDMELEEYGIEKIVTLDFIDTNESLIVTFDYGVLDYILIPNFDSDFVSKDISNIFEELAVDKGKVHNAMLKNKIMFFDTKKDFINLFMKNQDMHSLVQYIFDYDSDNDDFVKSPEDIAITYLAKELKLFNDRHNLYKTTIEENPYYKYIFINTLVTNGYKNLKTLEDDLCDF